MSKQVFITGAAGFIGFHLAKALAKRGDHVIGYDNFNAYYSPSLKKARKEELVRLGIEVVEGDLGDEKALEEVFCSHQTTHLIHLAAQAGVRYSLSHPKAYLKDNIDGFLNILELCRKYPDTYLTYASSSSVYGLNKKTPFDESDRTDRQASLYGVTKKCNELMAASYHHLFGIKATGLRFFTVYGPWGRPDMAYYSFTQAIMEEKPISLFNGGEMKRDFTYIEDILEGILKAIDLETSLEIFNLGTHRPIALKEFVLTLEALIGKKAIIHFADMQPGDVVETFADLSHSEKLLGFHPKTDLKTGLGHFVDWYRYYQALI